MATKPKAILSTHDGREASPITKASNVLFENGQTAQDILNDRQDAMISPVIENSSSMFKVGQGDDVDYSANVVNGAYESMVLKGKSMVNCIQEPSSQDVVLPYEFEEGRYVTINDTKESGALGVELKGQTLVNISKPAIGNGNTVSTYANIGMTYYQPKSNTKYFCYIENLANDTFTYYLNNITFNLPTAELQRFTIEPNSIVTKIATTVENPDKYGLWLSVSSLNEATEKQNLRIMLIEYQEGMENWDLPYFEGMTSCKMPILHTVGKNLVDYKNYNPKVNTGQNPQEIIVDEQGLSFNVDSKTWKSLWYDLYLESGEKYTLSYNTNLLKCFIFKSEVNTYVSSELIGDATGIDAIEDKIQKVTKTFTAPSTGFIRIRLTSEQKVGNHILQNFQIEKGSTATSYEPYKSSILSLPEEVVLRSLPNGVCDTFNTRTGVYTQRIGEVVLDGENYTNFSRDSELENDTTCKYFISNFFSQYLDGKGGQNEKVVLNCNYLPPVSFNHIQDKTLSTYPCIANSGAGSLNLRVGKDIDSTSLLLAYLQSNPITIQYELATPIITKINLPSTLKSWNTTTHIYSEIPENTLYPTLSHSNPTYPVILKPSTKYSIVANSYSNDHTNSAINFNLGGATTSTTVGNRVTTIATPSTLSNELLTMSGRGNKLNNVMVVEGDVVGDEPYFEGICDCKSPILTNTGKNLYYMHQDINNTYGISEFYENGFVTTSLNAMGIFGLTKKTNIAEQGDNILNPTSIQEGKTYTISCKVTKIFGTSSKLHFLGLRCHNHEGDVIKVSNVGWNDWELEYDFSNTVELSKTVVCNKSFNHVVFGGQIGFDGSNDVYKITDFQLEESSTPTSHEPYKSNILSANGDKIELTEDMFEQGTVSGINGIGTKYEVMKENSTVRLRSKDIIRVKPNTSYRLFREDGYDGWCVAFDSNQRYLGKSYQTETFVTDSQTHYIVPVLKNINNTTMLLEHITKFKLSEVDKTIVLRSLPNGVCDTLNVETGEYVQRIGETTLDGSSRNDLNYHNVMKEQNGQFFRMIINQCSFYNKSKYGNCDKLAFYHTDKTNVPVEGVFPYGGDRHFYIQISTSRISGADSMEELSSELKTAFRDWLQANPIIIQYELATPIVSTIDVQGFPYAYTNGHVQLSSGSIEQSLTPKVEYSVATNRNGQIRSNQRMVERHQKQLDQLQAIILANLVNSQYNQTLTTLKYELSRV